MKFLNMNEDEINWEFARDEIIFKGCRINTTFGPLIFEPTNKKSASIDYCDLITANNENLLTKSYLEYSKKKKTFWYNTLKKIE